MENESDKNMADEIIEFMKIRLNIKSKLASDIEESNWNRKKKIFKPIDSGEIEYFPILTVDEYY